MGLINQGMGAEPEEMDEGPESEMPEDETGEDEGPGIDDPAYQEALKVAMATLYKQGAAKALAQSLRAAPSPAQGLADSAYKMTQIVDEQTGGNVPEDLLGALAVQLLGETAEVAEAAGLTIDGKTIAEATRLMLEMYLDDSGADPAQVQQIKQQMAALPADQVGAQAQGA
jgi:hypothetical protein